MKDTLVYAGTYTGGKSKGIYVYRLQTQNLEVSQNILLVPLGLAVETPNPSFLEIDIKRRLVFAVNELETGAVSSFSVEPNTGKLTLLNQRPSMGAGPCHLALDKEARNLLVANFGSGSVAVLPVGSDGRLGEATGVVQHAESVRTEVAPVDEVRRYSEDSAVAHDLPSLSVPPHSRSRSPRTGTILTRVRFERCSGVKSNIATMLI